jgi:hypothetical protein
MPGRKIICDTQCEIYNEIAHGVDDTFWNFEEFDPPPNSIVIFARQTLNQYHERIKKLAQSNVFLPVLANPTEGSSTLKLQCERLGLLELVKDRRMLLVGGGEMEPELNCLTYDCYMGRPLGYEHNTEQCARANEIYSKTIKPYKFLFLNGRTRPHRKYMIEKLRSLGLLDQALWTNLDTTPVYQPIYSELLDTPCELKLLPEQYEVGQFQSGIKEQYAHSFVKHELFDNHWGEIYILAEPYIDTYFSLISETVFEYPYSFRTEKIYKPIAMGHPFIAVANRGFYRDLHNAGFQTYHSVIDESFDMIDNNQDRLNRIAQVVADLCNNNLIEFLVACESISKYNQQHMAELAPQIYNEFPARFFNFIQQNS